MLTDALNHIASFRRKMTGLRSTLHRIILSLSVLVMMTSDIRAADPPAKDESAGRLGLMKKAVGGVEVTIGKDGSEKLTRVDEPIQRWSNPLVRIVDATVFLWTRDGRPTAVSQVADVTDEGVWQEFQSLTTEPLRGTREGQSYWTPTAAGIKWERAPTTETPVATPELRRVQMRKIAEKFRVADLFEFKEPNQLRLLATPLYRYSAPKAGVRDGALFSYALGTDPEVLLLIEAQQEGDAETWKEAFARLTGFACRAALDDKEVWSCKVMPFPYPPDSTFFSIRVTPPIRGQ